MVQRGEQTNQLRVQGRSLGKETTCLARGGSETESGGWGLHSCFLCTGSRDRRMSSNNNMGLGGSDGHGRRVGSGTGKGVDKSNFTQTCNLLSQFLKDKRNTCSSSSSSPPLHLSLPFSATSAKSDTTTPPAATMDLITNLQDSDDASKQINASALDFLPQFMENPSIKQSNLSRSETHKSQSQRQPQLSIFYAGKVLVFDGFPPEKATEVMELATKLGSDEDIQLCNETPKNSKSVAAPPPPPPSNTTAQQHAPDMRYPRRASLVKFLEKRKERVIAKGPYHMNNPIPKQDDGSSSGGDPEQHQSSKHFDLNS